MTEYLRALISTRFIAQGFCMRWQSDLIWLDAVSDAAIAIAYLAIAALLLHFVRKRRDIPFHRIFWAFCVFIVSYGFTHAMDVVTLWYPLYRLAAILKALTAVSSVSTAVALVCLMPRLLRLPSSSQMAAANRSLEWEIAQRKQAELALESAHRDTEAQVEIRAAQLARTSAEKLQSDDMLLLESERALKEREQLLSALFENGSMGDFSWDIASDMVSAHPSVWKLYGLSPEQGTGPGDWFRSRQHPEDAPAIEAATECALVAHAPLEVEFRVVRDDRSMRWISCRALVTRDQAGVPVLANGFNIDITALKTAEAEVQRREQLFRELANAMPQVVWTATPDGQTDYFNDRWFDLTGSTIAVDAEHNWQPFVHPEDVPICTDSWFSTVRLGRPFELQLRFWDARLKQFRWHLSRAIPVRNNEGKVSRWIGTSTDIHDQKIAEDRLEQQVRNRTRDLEASLLEKETLLKEVHHRVKNNLQVISSLLNMQANGLTDALAVSALRDSQRRVLSMAMVHERLYGEQQMERIDFGEYAEALMDELIRSLGRAGIGRQLRTSRVLLQIDQAIPCGLILSELVTNALKYAYPGDRCGDIAVELEETEGQMISLTVSDKGVGMPPGFNWKKSKSLGLPIVQILSKQIGGEFVVVNDGGVTFTIRFPRHGSMPAERRAEETLSPVGVH